MFSECMQTDWVDKGRGTLTVRASSQPEGSSTSVSTQVVFTMDSGRVLVNGALYKGLSITKVRQKPVPQPQALLFAWSSCLTNANSVWRLFAFVVSQLRGDEKRPG